MNGLTGGASPIAERRLAGQRLVGEPFPSAVAAVRWLGAVQSQDYFGAKWALGQRARGTTEAELDRLFDAGAILRTHVMRPTWHFVLPEDARWLLELTGPKVNRALVARHRELGLDPETVSRSMAAFSVALDGGRHLTREELSGVLSAAGIAPDGQRLAHLLMGAELRGLVTSGPRRGRQFTYALLAERAPNARVLNRAEAVTELTKRYFRSHGPAQLQDFVWWSGLTVADARSGIATAGDDLAQEEIDGGVYWFDAEAGPVPRLPEVAHLLPNYDEYTVGYRDRKAVMDGDREFVPSLFPRESLLTNILTIGGRVRGAWRRSARGTGVRVDLRLLDRLNPGETAALEAARIRLAGFLGCTIDLRSTVRGTQLHRPAEDFEDSRRGRCSYRASRVTSRARFASWASQPLTAKSVQCSSCIASNVTTSRVLAPTASISTVMAT